MKTWLKGSLLLLLVALVLVGCGSANENNSDAAQDGNQSNAVNEDNVSPVPDGTNEPVKKEITFFYADNDLMDMYRITQEVEADSEEDLPKAALEQWMKGPELEGLTNLVPPEVVIEKVEFEDRIAYVSFSEEIKNANLGSSGESFLIDQITLIMQQFGYDATQILINGEVVEDFLGHITIDEPIQAPDPENYEWFEKGAS